MEYNPIFDDKELNKLDRNLTLIPYDIKKDIYINYFQPIINAKKICDKLFYELKSINSKKLNIIDILPLLYLILNNKYAIDYLYNNYYYYDEYSNTKINIFKNLYDKIIINNNRNFILLSDDVKDFAQSWLMYLYH